MGERKWTPPGWVPPEQREAASEASQKPDDAPPGMRVPLFDPVLRLALIRKGVITPDDLVQAEAEMKATMGGDLG